MFVVTFITGMGWFRPDMVQLEATGQNRGGLGVQLNLNGELANTGLCLLTFCQDDRQLKPI